MARARAGWAGWFDMNRPAFILVRARLLNVVGSFGPVGPIKDGYSDSFGSIGSGVLAWERVSPAQSLHPAGVTCDLAHRL